MGLQSITVDKVVLVGDDVGSFSYRMNDASFEYIDKITSSSYPYKKAWHCRDGSYVQWSDSNNHRAIRVEFNPNNVEQENIEKILETMKYGKFNRVDIAFDFEDVDLSDYQFVDNLSRKRNYWMNGSGRLETLYIGAPGSGLRIRIYDKAKEQGMEGDWWRIESQITDEWVKPLNGDFLDDSGQNFNVKPFLPNFFDGLKVFVPSLSESGLKMQEQAMIEFLVRNPEKWGEVSPNSRRKYKKILANLPINKEIELGQIFKENKSDTMYHIQKWRKIANKNNVIEKV